MPWCQLDCMEPNKYNEDREAAWAAGLRSNYNEVAREPLPDRFRDLLEQLDEVDLRSR
jgi:hypothetical protein